MTSWKMRLGDPNLFAMQLELTGTVPGVDGKAQHSAEYAASWGSFQLWAGGLNLCSHYEMGEQLEAVHWYLLPLIEWWIENWDPVFHEARLPHPARAGEYSAWAFLHQNFLPPPNLDEEQEADWLDTWQAWWQRHSLQAARDGGLFPEVVIRRWQDQVEVSWGNSGLVGAPEHYRFLGASDFVRLPLKAVASPVHELLGHTLKHLRKQLPQSRRLQELDDRLGRLPAPSSQAVRVGWLSGLPERWPSLMSELAKVRPNHPEALDELFLQTAPPQPSLVVEGACHAPMMFGSLAPEIDSTDFLTIANLQIDAFEKQRQPSKVDALARPHSLAGHLPWQLAYDLAIDLLERLQLPDAAEQPINLERILSELGIETRDTELSDRATRGLAFVGPDQRPTIAVNSMHPANGSPGGRRFTLAHELCHLLFDRDQAQQLALASGPWTSLDVEQRANAFAAMVLIPPVTIQAWIERAGPFETKNQVIEFARQQRVGVRAALEHLTNLRFINETQRQIIDEEFV